MTGAMGKRTKYQREDVAQMVVLATSSLVGAEDPQNDVPSPPTLSASLDTVENRQREDSSGMIVGTRGEDGSSSIAWKGNGVGDGESVEPVCNQESGWQHSEWELGRRLVRETTEGEEAAVREVLLDSMDGGAAENIILEGGPRLSDEEVKMRMKERIHTVDQAVLLALCLDVQNSNPEVRVCMPTVHPVPD